MPPELIRESSLDGTLESALGTDREPYQQSEIHRVTRPALEIVWLEQRYMDDQHNRDARFRVAIARGAALCLISMNYWANRAAGLERVRDEALRSLAMGMRVDDPAAGPVVR